MVEISVNGEAVQVEEGQVLQVLLEQHQPDSPLFAVAVNGTFVPRQQYAASTIKAGDAVDIVVPVSGG